MEFHEEESVQKALAMTGQKLLGIPVMVQLTEAEKNRLALQAEQTVYVSLICYQSKRFTFGYRIN